MPTLTIHPELHALIPPLSADELAQLEANLLAEGCREALIVWEGHNILLDGHNRYEICQRHGLPFGTRLLTLPDLDAAKAWMIACQLGRRNLTPEQLSFLRGTHYVQEKKAHGGTGANQHTKEQSGKSYHSALIDSTAATLAGAHKVSEKTIRNDAAYAKAIVAIAAAIPEARQALLARDTKVSRQEVRKLATLVRANPQTARHVLEAVQASTTPKAAKGLIAEASKAMAHVTAQTTSPDTVPTAQRRLETVAAADGRPMYVLHRPNSHPVFNRTNEMVDWASWTWNPVTGCWHDCGYCYAREIAHNERMAVAYPKQFEPTFHPDRLAAPANTPVPKVLERPADRNVFVCSMADLFGRWVPDDWIMQVFAQVQQHPEWTFLFLTKFPQRLAAIGELLGGFPDNAWLGCTVDEQARVPTAERAFRQIQASVRWLSVEPMNEPLVFHDLSMFNWLVIGGQTASHFNKTPARQPEWSWVEALWVQARGSGLAIYMKENLTVRPKEVPRQTGGDHAPSA